MTSWSTAPRWARWLTWCTAVLACASVYGVGWSAGWALEAGHPVQLGSAMVGGANLTLALVSAPAATVWSVVVARTWRTLAGAPMRVLPLVVWAVLVASMLRGAYYGAARALDGSGLDLWAFTHVITLSRILEAVVPIVALWPALLAMGLGRHAAARWVALGTGLGLAGYASLVAVLV